MIYANEMTNLNQTFNEKEFIKFAIDWVFCNEKYIHFTKEEIKEAGSTIFHTFGHVNYCLQMYRFFVDEHVNYSDLKKMYMKVE